MTLQEQKAHFERFTAKQAEIMLKKGNDYATEDRLSNFKTAGANAGVSAEQACLTLIATKVARVGVLLAKGSEPENEAIRDSVIDLADYAFLLDCLLEEREKSRSFSFNSYALEEYEKMFLENFPKKEEPLSESASLVDELWGLGEPKPETAESYVNKALSPFGFDVKDLKKALGLIEPDPLWLLRAGRFGRVGEKEEPEPKPNPCTTCKNGLVLNPKCCKGSK